jgi:hypothetical protein
MVSARAFTIDASILTETKAVGQGNVGVEEGKVANEI